MFTAWCLVVGVLMIAIALSDTWRQQLPVSTAALYLLAGVALGPVGLGLIDLDPVRDAPLIERLCEVAVLVSLFAVGLRLRAPLRHRLWRGPLMLATVAMLLTIAGVAGVGWLLGLPPGPALLLGAVLAPTDPVLASDVQVEHPRDLDRLRFSLSGEGGLNDGAAFPFVVLALGVMTVPRPEDFFLRWFTVDVVWAVTAGLGVGWLLGLACSRGVVYLRREREQALGMESFLTLGLIALTYGVALAIHAYGFLAVFAAGLAMRQVERQDSGDDAPANADPAIGMGPDAAADADRASTYMAREVLDFTLDIERLVELGTMLMIGSLLRVDMFHVESLTVALLLMAVLRPLAVYLTTSGRLLRAQQRRLVAWFGIRGIGSMYYLAYALVHQRADEVSLPGRSLIVDATLVTIALSVLLHGSSSTPFMRRYRRSGRIAAP